MQLWSVMVLAASHRQILTYDLVAKVCGLKPRGLGDYLRGVQQHCIDKRLPPLTSIVVNKETGLPGSGFTAAADDVPRAQMRVFRHNWLEMNAPNESDLKQAYSRLQALPHSPAAGGNEPA